MNAIGTSDVGTRGRHAIMRLAPTTKKSNVTYDVMRTRYCWHNMADGWYLAGVVRVRKARAERDKRRLQRY